MATPQITPPASTAPEGGTDAAAFSATALPSLNPENSPYKPLSLPEVKPRQAPQLPEQQPIQNLGAVNKAGAIASIADSVLRGALKGYDQRQAMKAEQANKKLGALDSLQKQLGQQYVDAYNEAGSAHPDATPQQILEDPNVKNLHNQVLAVHQATLNAIGNYLPPLTTDKKTGKQKEKKNLIQRMTDHQDNPDEALRAYAEAAQQLGPTAFYQVKSPQQLKADYQQRQTGATTAQTAGVAAGNQLTHQQAQADRDRVLATPEDKRTPEDNQKLDSAQSILSPVPKASVDKPITRPDLQTVKLKNGQEISAQWNGKQWTYLNGTEIPSDQLGGEAKVAQKVSTSQWAQGLNAYAQSHKADPNDWQTIRSYEQDQYSAKNPYAERKLSLTARNTAVGEARLALQRSSTDWNETKDIFKQLGPDMKIQATAKAADDYTTHPTGPGDAALTLAFFEAAKAADPGSGSGIRFTKQEQDLIQHARGFADAAQANVERFGKGTLFDDNQRQQMADIIKTAAKRSNEATANYLGAAQKLNPRATAAATGGASDGNTGKFSVTDPKGKVHPFDTQEQVDHFKKLAGIH